MRFRLVLAYDGTRYLGFQKQLGGGTVQDILESALAAVFGAPVDTQYSGRTDQGVHADEQVLVFEAPPGRLPIPKLPLILNLQLPGDIRVKRVEPVDDLFHPRFSARVRLYQYRLIAGKHFPAQSVAEHHRAWQPGIELDAGEVLAFLEPLVGAHDFTTFCSAQDPSPSKVREIFRVDAWRDGHLLLIELWGNAFLRNQVRAIVGNLIHALKRHKPAAYLGELLAARDPLLAKARAPARGLTLRRVFYAKLFGEREYYKR